MDIIAIDTSARTAAKEAQDLVDGMRNNMHEFLLYGVPRKELEKVLTRVFQEADPEHLGHLHRNVCHCKHSTFACVPSSICCYSAAKPGINACRTSSSASKRVNSA